MVEGLKRDAENSVFIQQQFYSMQVHQQPVKLVLGDSSGKGTPGYIPNPEVKLASADGT